MNPTYARRSQKNRHEWDKDENPVQPRDVISKTGKKGGFCSKTATGTPRNEKGEYQRAKKSKEGVGGTPRPNEPPCSEGVPKKKQGRKWY